MTDGRKARVRKFSSVDKAELNVSETETSIERQKLDSEAERE